MSSAARSRSRINQLSKGLTMNRNIFTRRGQTMRVILDTIGALALIAGLLTLALAYFDVLVK